MTSILLNQKLIFGLMGGLGLFLFGMKIMSEGLQKLAGSRMRKILSALTNNRLIGTFVGIAVTAIIQSSSATTVMVVGFVNAGLMSLMQAIGVIMGANVGTTITAQLIAFKVTKFALPAIGVGAAIKLFASNRKYVYFGEILLGFGILFFGLSTMKGAFDPVKGSEEFRQFFTLVGDNPLLGVLIGAILTVIVQSSSATIGITVALASSGVLSFEASIALILGENIGTTVTANLAAIGTNVAARRTAFAHFLFNFLGTVYMILLMPYFMSFISSITPGDANFIARSAEEAKALGVTIGDKPFIARHIANTHTLFNIINVIVFLPFIGLLAKAATFVIRGDDVEMEFRLKYLDNRVLNTPPIALGQARSEVKRMADLALEMVDETQAYYADLDPKRIQRLEKMESLIDLLQKEITDFLVTLSQQSISQDASRDIAGMMHMVNDLERVGDHCENLWELALKMKTEKVSFSELGNAELLELSTRAREFLAFLIEAIERRDTTIALKADQMESHIDDLESSFRNNHIQRLNTGECTVISGLIFTDMLHNYEKIGDHTFNLSKIVVGAK